MFITLFLIALNVFAIDPQEGGGGNVCYSPSLNRVVMIDEILSLQPIPPMSDESAPSNLKLMRSDSGKYMITDMTILSHVGEVDVIFKQFADFDPELSGMFRRILKSFSHVYVSDGSNEGAWEIDPVLEKFCEQDSIRVAFLSIYGQSFISRALWKKLNYRSQKVLIVHEVVRFIQVLMGAEMISNQEISLWTMLLIDKHFGALYSRPGLQKIRNALKNVRGDFTGQNPVNVIQQLRQTMYDAIAKENLDNAFEMKKKYFITDLALNNKSLEPLAYDFPYARLFEKTFAKELDQNMLRAE